MLPRLEARLHSLLRRLDIGQWLARVLNLRRAPATGVEPGLVVLQIDGLSRPQFEQALRRGEMPFLAGLLQREHYQTHDLYSGLPSTTPAVQGEIFYGLPRAVPAFHFHDRETGRDFRMYEPDDAVETEARLAREAKASLLEEGSVYASVYGNGAREAHYCATRFGVGPMLRDLRPLQLAAFVALNLPSLLRVAGLTLVETLLALGDFVRGVTRRGELWVEFKFIPTRVAICIGLRELVTLGARLDTVRGRPVIYANYLGYDEQSHRRGPDSAFAHWVLRGIDRSLRRVCNAAHRSPCRDYEIFILSDHGQEAVKLYEQEQHETIHETVQRLLGQQQSPPGEHEHRGIQLGRARQIGGRRIQKLFSGAASPDRHAQPALVTVMGPLGHIYLSDQDRIRKPELARRLAREAKVPLVAFRDSDDRLCIATPDDDYELPQDATAVFGEEHPFLQSVTEDFCALCRHANAGDLVFGGWSAGHGPLSFSTEHGAHGGPGPQETHAFALLPARHGKRSLRPRDIHQAALRVLHRAPQAPPPRPAARRLRVMSWNVHGCLGNDGKLSPGRIARAIARYQPDIVALQELDAGRARSHRQHQAETIARLLRMEHHFHPVLEIEQERYGNALLSRLPLRLIRSDTLPSPPSLEPRGALWAETDWQDMPLQILVTHLGLRPRERHMQARTLAGPEWLQAARRRGPTLLCGDCNARPASTTLRLLTRDMQDCQAARPGQNPRRTWPARMPLARIDYILADSHFRVRTQRVPRNRLTLAASDHLPLIVDLELVPGTDSQAGGQNA